MANRYVLKFTKNGYAKYTSHLDMLRFFKRAFRKSGISLRYSQGFNPHPKMSFAQPLSLGYSSSFELLNLRPR
ncbi:MAG: TIGR03936 family radical SAM-associated protein [Anaerovoracaceae bacterium]